jgi:hypothetical protein
VNRLKVGERRLTDDELYLLMSGGLHTVQEPVVVDLLR